MKNDDEINESSISDLIHYAEDEKRNTFDDEPETDDELDDEITETDDETVSDKKEPVSEEVSEENKKTEEEPISEEAEEEPEDELALEEADEESSSEEEKTLSNNVNYDDDTDYPDYETDVGFFDDLKIGDHKGIIIGVIIGIIVVIAFIMIDTGIIGNYKNNFSNNISKVFKTSKTDKNQLPDPTQKPDEQYNTEIKSNEIVSFEGANETEFVPYKNGVVCAKMNHMSYIDGTGTVVWEIDTAIVDPILKVDGNYILIAEKGRNKICLYIDNKLQYDVDDPDTVMSAELSSNGDVVVVTDKSSYRGGISVYNKSGEQIFSWASGSDAVICADISAASRSVAVALLNSDVTAKTTVQLFNVNETESYAKIEMPDTVVYELQFVGDKVNAFGDNRVTGISSSGKIVYDNDFSNVQLTHSAIDSNGNKLLAFDDGNIPMLNLYGKNGFLKNSTTLIGVTDFIDINKKYILYNIGRDIYFGKTNSKVMSKYTAAMDIKNLIIVSDTTFVVIYSNSLEVVTV